jgi:hypothetical protein
MDSILILEDIRKLFNIYDTYLTIENHVVINIEDVDNELYFKVIKYLINLKFYKNIDYLLKEKTIIILNEKL